MTSIRACEIPDAARLRNNQGGKTYADCYVTEAAGEVSLAAYVEAFYTTPLFKVERGILRWLAARPSTDAEAKALAEGKIESFAAWRVEGRGPNQLLLADMTGRTKSWMMVTPACNSAGPTRTSLYFGSAVVARSTTKSGESRMGFAFRALLGFHKLYSRLLLAAACSRVLASQRSGTPRDHTQT